MRENYIRAVVGRDGLFSRLSDLFIREADTDTGPGMHYLVDLVGAGSDGVQVVSIVCENHDIPIRDFRKYTMLPIRDLVTKILECSPPRCVIILDTRDNELMLKVRGRIARKTCDLRFRRVIFCLVDHEMPSGSCRTSFHVPGSLNDKKAMLLYHVPDRLWDQWDQLQTGSLEPLVAAMSDYALFEPRVWRQVRVDGTLHQFLTSALYQIVRQVRSDPGICDGDYPVYLKSTITVKSAQSTIGI